MHCRALIFPPEEDFGIVPVEAQGFGKAVIAYKQGGVQETVLDGQTGILFDKQTVSSLKAAILKFEKTKIDHEKCKLQAQKFNQNIFKKQIKQIVEVLWEKK